MGLLNVPAPIFSAIDQVMSGFVPPIGRLMIWAMLAGAITITLYRFLSPQARIGRAKREARLARRHLNEFDGELADAGPLIRAQFLSAFKHIGLVVPGTLLSILPLLCLLVWLDAHYSHGYPPAGNAPEISVQPGTLSTEWESGDIPHVRVFGDGEFLLDVALTSPVPVIEKRHWWNQLAGNPLGYLPDGSEVERIQIALPEKSYLTVGPDWLRSWPVIFLPVMFTITLLIYRLAGIE